MKTKRRLSMKQFERRHPGTSIVVCKDKRGHSHVVALQSSNQAIIAQCEAATLEGALYVLSSRCYKVAAFEAMERQGWCDVNTGQTGVSLQAHHIKKRSKGRLDATENLAGVTAETHGYQHERRGK